MGIIIRPELHDYFTTQYAGDMQVRFDSLNFTLHWVKDLFAYKTWLDILAQNDWSLPDFVYRYNSLWKRYYFCM